ncbi:MAG: TonB-dependent receptor [Pseudomonadota bacterium]
MKRILLALLAASAAGPASADDFLDELVVTSTRSPNPIIDESRNVAVLGSERIDTTAHAHVHELMTHVAGVWVSRGSGQESLPSVRSPVLTGAGSCGAFLTLEDGIPSRPNGFCNVNQLFELPTELANQIEVIRGPGNALYGSNGLHGTLNIITPAAGDVEQHGAGIDVGPNDYYRARAVIGSEGDAPWIAGTVFAHDGGFRDDSGYQQGKVFAKKAWSNAVSDFTVGLSYSDLDQQTAGFIFGEDAYDDEDLRTQNLNPEAYRLAESLRGWLVWQTTTDDYTRDVRFYLRRTEMEFLQHFLPGQPVEKNGHLSVGALSQWRVDTRGGAVTVGVDVDVADVYLRETQFGPTIGSAFLVATRPEGKHYDYDVKSLNVGLYAQWQGTLSPSLSLSAGVRAESSHYDYRNNMLSGNTRDDGTPCGFGGCLYTRPEDRSDRFIDLAPNVGVTYSVSDSATFYANLSRGFRAPQMTELYRLQNGQQVSDLDSETIDSLELGWRYAAGAFAVDASIFNMRKQNSVFRDAEGFNVSNGESRHLGLEVLFDVVLSTTLGLTVNGTYAEHTYDFDTVAARGETFVRGRDVDTAPLWQGSAELNYAPTDQWSGALQWVSLGPYYLDAENLRDYPGHDIANLRVSYAFAPEWRVTGHLRNITDSRYADRADFAFGNYRYFPGRERELFIRVDTRF